MSKLKFIVTFINLNGFNLALAITAITLGLSNSSLVSLPIKGAVVALMAAGIFLNIRRVNNYNISYFLFCVFIGFYGLKLLLEASNPNPNLLHSVPTLAVYMLAHCILPFSFYFFLVGRRDYQVIFKALFISGVMFNILVFFMYGDLLLAGVSRIGNYQTNQMVDDMTLSPLVLAYSSMMVIVLSVFTLISKKISLKEKIIYIFAIGSAIPGFLLGASRGAMLGLLFSFLLYLLISRKVSKAKFAFYFSILVVGVFNLAIFFRSAVFDRFTGLFGADNSNNLRFVLYETTFMQFAESPIIGGSIQNDTVNHYPHNIYLEAMTATGIFGFLSLCVLTGIALNNVFFIFRRDAAHGWIGIMFITYLVQSFFNTAIYLAIGFWIFLAILVGYKRVRRLNFS